MKPLHPTARCLLTVITESMLESTLLAELERLGARGYTVTDARGKGSRGGRDAAWQESSNIRIEVLCDAELASLLAEHLERRYYADYAMVLFVTEVAVLRPEKF